MNDTRISYTDGTRVVRYFNERNTPWKFDHMKIILSEEDSVAVGEYFRRIEGHINVPFDEILTRILRMGITMAKQQVSIDKYLDERDAEAGE